MPCIVGVEHSPGAISLGENLGERASVTVTFKDFRHSDTGAGGDKYLANRSYNPYTNGTYFGRFRTRHRYLKGKPLRVIRGALGDAIGAMDTRHYVVESFSGPDVDGLFTLVAKDVLKLADNDRAQAPVPSNGSLLADITSAATTATLTPTGIGDAEYATSGYVTLAGKEVAAFTRKQGQDAYTKFLAHFNGANAGTTFADSSAAPHTITRVGNTQTSTAQLKFGSAAALFDGTGDYLTLDGSADFAFGTGDFTIDFWFRPAAVGAARTLYDSRPTSTEGLYPRIYVNASNKVSYHTNSADRITGTTTIALNTWYHVVVSRAAGVTRLFVNGTQEGASYTDANTYLNGASRPIVGAAGTNVANENYNGYMDELEVSKGVARWVANFTPATAETSTTSGDVLTLTRAQFNTTAIAVKAGDRVQTVLRYTSQDVANILYDLFVNYAGIDPAFIPLTSWQAETAAYIGTLYTGTITEPTGVRALASELVEQAALAMWWDDAAQLIRLQVLRQVSATADTFDEQNTQALTVQEQPDKRLTQVWVYFNQRNPCERLEENNFQSIAVVLDLQRESDYGSAGVKKILSRWIPNGGRAAALRVGDTQLARYKDPPRIVEFSLFRDSATVSPGGGYQVGSWAMQDDEGGAELVPVQVTRVSRNDVELRVTAEEILFDYTDSGGGGTGNDRVIILDTSQNNVNLQTLHDTLFSPITVVGSITLTLVIDTGVVIGSANVTTPALNVGTFPVGLPITVRVKGRIQGAGGKGGDGSVAGVAGGNGTAGGSALYTRQALTLDLASGSGEVWGGGGGGGGGTGSTPGGTGGGGGGAGTVAGLKGTNFNGGTAPADGTATTGGAGGSPSGGAGGGPGLAGANGSRNSGAAAVGTGGAAGNQIDGVSYCTVSGTGDRRGPTVN
ncbi:MAG: LamG domain-containing protein [Saprospiraceae bacterium]